MNLKTIIILLLASMALAGCAKQGMPSGGPKDVTPPKSLSMTPPSGSLNSQSQTFYIEFDEYVVIKDAENNILVTPPMKERPEVKTKGKGIKVTIKDSLQPNTTYLFQFKEAIADFNEGNPLPSLEYVFSTGDYIDSMTLKGTVVEALSLKPDKDIVSVWLFNGEHYRQAVNASSDTNVAFPLPDYTTRTDKNGHFSFNNIKPGRYHIVAVKDDDKNNAIGASETMAFLDTAAEAIVMVKTENEERKTENEEQPTANSQQPTLHLSTPKVDRQRLTSSKFMSAGKVVLTSLLPLQKPSLDAGGEEVAWRLNRSRDTLTLWTLRKECDSLQLVVNDPSGINDTLRLNWHSSKKSQKGSTGTGLKANNMRINTSSLHYYDSLALLFTIPLDTSLCKTDSVARIMLLKDSSIEYCNALIDSTAMKALLLYRFRQGEKYTIDIAKDLFSDIYSTGNDSLHTTITVTKAEDYGNLTLTLENEKRKIENGELMIIELIDENEKVVCRKSLTSGSIVKFENLKPAKYRVRAIIDSNGNGEWDVGDFASQRQPEKVIYLDKTLDIRANWDFEEKLQTP